jgi:hypothetical protein
MSESFDSSYLCIELAFGLSWVELAHGLAGLLSQSVQTGSWGNCTLWLGLTDECLTNVTLQITLVMLYASLTVVQAVEILHMHTAVCQQATYYRSGCLPVP